jgi:DDE superfamily endonuclease
VASTLSCPGAGMQTIPEMLAAAGARAVPAESSLDPECAAGAVTRYRALEALRAFRRQLYECLPARADALFDLTDAILCADHAVTSLAELSLVPEFRRGHGALYGALARGRIDGEKLGTLLARTVPQLVDGPEAAAWAAEHDRIDYGPLETVLASLPARDADAVRDACARWRRQRFAVDGTCYPRPDAECSPGRGHVHHACSCDADARTVPGWEFQFIAAVGRLRTAWAALIDVAHISRKNRSDQAAAQVKTVLRRLRPGRDAMPLFLFDAGYSAAALTWRLRGQPAHILVRLAFGAVFCRDQLTWPGKPGRPGGHGAEVHCLEPADLASAETGKGPRGREKPLPPNPEPDEELLLPDTAGYGSIRAEAWHGLHPRLNRNTGYFKGWRGDLPVLRGTLIHVTVARYPDGSRPRRGIWLWHAGPGPLSLAGLARAYFARFDIEHVFRFAKGALGLTAAKVRTPGQAGRWIRLVMAASAQLRHARGLTADLRRPWEKRPDPARPLAPGRVRRGFPHIHPLLGTPARMPKPTRPGPGRPKGSTSTPAPRHRLPKKTGTQNEPDTIVAA